MPYAAGNAQPSRDKVSCIYGLDYIPTKVQLTR